MLSSCPNNTGILVTLVSHSQLGYYELDTLVKIESVSGWNFLGRILIKIRGWCAYICEKWKEMKRGKKRQKWGPGPEAARSTHLYMDPPMEILYLQFVCNHPRTDQWRYTSTLTFKVPTRSEFQCCNNFINLDHTSQHQNGYKVSNSDLRQGWGD